MTVGKRTDRQNKTAFTGSMKNSEGTKVRQIGQYGWGGCWGQKRVETFYILCVLEVIHKRGSQSNEDRRR